MTKAFYALNSGGIPTIWFVPFNQSKGVWYAEGDVSYMNFSTEKEALAYMQGYNKCLKDKS